MFASVRAASLSYDPYVFSSALIQASIGEMLSPAKAVFYKVVSFKGKYQVVPLRCVFYVRYLQQTFVSNKNPYRENFL